MKIRINVNSTDFTNFFCESEEHIVEITRAQCGKYVQKFTLTLFWQKFRESNAFTKEITK